MIVVIDMLLEVDPAVMLDGVQNTRAPQSYTRERIPSAEEDELRDFVSVVLADTEDTWGELFAQMELHYDEPTLVLFSSGVDSACGFADSTVGPFYCPSDNQVYLDLDFFYELNDRFGAPGDFAQAYVVAHEVGHHIQALLGIETKVRETQRQAGLVDFNALSAMLEQQVYSLAGVWGHCTEQQGMLEGGDLEEALKAANAIGDDRLQMEAAGHVNPDSFTYGTSERRMRWFRRGFDHGDPKISIPSTPSGSNRRQARSGCCWFTSFSFIAGGNSSSAEAIGRLCRPSDQARLLSLPKACVGATASGSSSVASMKPSHLSSRKRKESGVCSGAEPLRHDAGVVEFLGRSPGPGEVGEQHGGNQATHGLLAHAAMADMRVDRRAIERITHRAALAATCQHGGTCFVHLGCSG